ncbi:hypothetical protein BDZ91DRAFT_714384 [Kalaharituber pfeilii]|nr:hypothetical protein BDZ91DRAFT_714384 [Kalaharituber pfeilii]
MFQQVLCQFSWATITHTATQAATTGKLTAGVSIDKNPFGIVCVSVMVPRLVIRALLYGSIGKIAFIIHGLLTPRINFHPASFLQVPVAAIFRQQLCLSKFAYLPSYMHA